MEIHPFIIPVHFFFLVLRWASNSIFSKRCHPRNGQVLFPASKSASLPSIMYN